jgi:hypothetical protein
MVSQRNRLDGFGVGNSLDGFSRELFGWFLGRVPFEWYGITGNRLDGFGIGQFWMFFRRESFAWFCVGNIWYVFSRESFG